MLEQSRSVSRLVTIDERALDTRQLMIAIDVALLRHARIGLTEETLQSIAADVQGFVCEGEIAKLRDHELPSRLQSEFRARRL